MFVTGHLIAGYLIYHALGGGDLTVLMLSVSSAVFMDVDYLWNKLHRSSITHSPIAYLPTLLLLHHPLLRYVPLGVYSHLLLDSIDYGIGFNPVSSRLRGLRLLKKQIDETRPFRAYLRSYYTKSAMPVLEGLLFITAAATIH